MEPMTLGSPSGSGSPAYLPSFLLGDPQTTTSPDKSRNVSFASSPQDFNRSTLGQKVLFGAQYQQSPQTATHAPPPTGPPTIGLFDSLRNDLNQVATPKKDNGIATPTQMGTPIHGSQHQQNYQQQQQLPHNVSAFGVNQSINPYNDSYLSNTSFNGSRSVLSPIGGLPLNPNQRITGQAVSSHNNFWITVFGFPPSSATAILQHFTNCGTIVDKIFAPQNGNWMHIKFSAQSECARALNYNEKILFNNIMIGVTQCNERSILEKENLAETGTPQTCRPRALNQSSYKAVQNDVSVITSPVSTSIRPSGIVNKAMELFFNW